MARGKKTGGGSRKGRPNKRHLDGERYARAIMEDPTVIETLLKQARDGVMSSDLAKTLLSYAYGKPIEVEGSGDSDSPRSVTITF
jgi:hypothetical protein